MNYDLKYQLRFKERMDRDGYGVYIFRREWAGPDGRTALMKPITPEFELLDHCAYFGDREPTFFLDRRTVHRDKIFDSIVDAMIEEGLRKSDERIAGEHAATLRHLEREKSISDRMISMLERK